MDVLQGVLEASPDAVLVVDETGAIRQANRNVQTVLGYSPHELEGKVVEDLLREEDRQHHVRFREEYMGDPEPRPMGRELDLYALQKDGTEVPVEISLGPIERDGDRYVVATITGIAQRKERERKLQHQNERLDEFASIVSHDLRNPLSVADGYLELAQEECDCEHLDGVAHAHDRMNALIEDLLTLAQEGETVRDVEQIDLDTLAHECWQTVDRADARLDADSGLFLEADRSRLKQLIENLLRNAIEHGSEDVRITLDSLETGFYLEDDGPGVPESIRDDVFSAGFTTFQEGTGYGLSIVKEVVEAHGWDIQIKESSEGGARFEITGVQSVRSR